MSRIYNLYDFNIISITIDNWDIKNELKQIERKIEMFYSPEKKKIMIIIEFDGIVILNKDNGEKFKSDMMFALDNILSRPQAHSAVSVTGNKKKSIKKGSASIMNVLNIYNIPKDNMLVDIYKTWNRLHRNSMKEISLCIESLNNFMPEFEKYFILVPKIYRLPFRIQKNLWFIE